MNNEVDVQSGAVIVDKEPYYYVDLVNEGDTQMIIAYELSKNSVDKYHQTGDPKLLARAGKVKYVNHMTLNPNANSKLTKYLINKLGNKNGRRELKVFYKTAIFVSPVVYGTDTINGNYTQGFYEMASQDIQGPLNGSYPKMDPTGVFIGLSHVHWIKDNYDFKKLNSYDVSLARRYSDYYRIMSNLG